MITEKTDKYIEILSKDNLDYLGVHITHKLNSDLINKDYGLHLSIKNEIKEKDIAEINMLEESADKFLKFLQRYLETPNKKCVFYESIEVRHSYNNELGIISIIKTGVSRNCLIRLQRDEDDCQIEITRDEIKEILNITKNYMDNYSYSAIYLKIKGIK
jgi:hypothetical protein